MLVLTDAFCDSHRLTGWNAVKSRVEQLGLTLTDDEVRRSVGRLPALRHG